MEIVITDGATLNPGDLSWAPLYQLGQVAYYDTSPQESVTARCKNADVIITNKTLIDEKTIAAAKNLKLIAVSATGYNNVNVQAAKEAGVVVCNVPEYGTFSVAQHTFALILELSNHVGVNVASTKSDDWSHELWSYTRKPIRELHDKVLGIVGFGRIGRQVANIGRAFGMRILFNNRSTIQTNEGKQVDLSKVFSDSDVISLHCPLTDANRHFVNLQLLSTMKQDAILINTSRGLLINEDDLVAALNNGFLAGAALDVLSQEPPAPNHPLIHHPKCIVTPHNAWISFEARRNLLSSTIENIKSFLQGNPVNKIIS